MVKLSPVATAGSERSMSTSWVPRGRQLVGGHPVQLGEPEEPRHADRPLTAFVGSEHGRLELLVGARLHVVERQALLTANRAKALADVSARP